MPTVAFVKSNLYKDSVALMRVAEDVQTSAGAQRVTLLMGTPANKEILAEAGLLLAEVAHAGPADLIVIIEAAATQTCEAAREAIEAKLTGVASANHGSTEQALALRSIAMGLEREPNARIAQISVPGAYAGAEALKALKAGLHVFLFSDNVPIEQEVALKQLATRKNLIVMGPDCGTAIIAGVPLGFANVVRRGAIGLVAASGTGLQEVTSQIHLLGGGISHAIGTGGRDVSAEVGGLSMLAGIRMLAADSATKVIVIISKPPAAQVTATVLDALRSAGKPAVVLFIGAASQSDGTITAVGSLFDAAREAVARCGVTPSAASAAPQAPALKFAGTQRFLRALYSGGTYCSEAQAIWRAQGLTVHSNVPLDKRLALADPNVSREHTAVDLGDDVFTVGRPHPMIDPGVRIARIAQEADDPTTAAIVLDVVLGYGSHADPAGALVPAIRDAQSRAVRAGRVLPVVAFVCGTEDDPQRRSLQEAKLREAGALLAANSTAAAQLAGAIVGARR